MYLHPTSDDRPSDPRGSGGLGRLGAIRSSHHERSSDARLAWPLQSLASVAERPWSQEAGRRSLTSARSDEEEEEEEDVDPDAEG
jgi:hypothetical protein